MRNPLRRAERREMVKLSKDGWTKEQLMRKFKRSFATVTDALAHPAVAPARKEAVKIVEQVNIALEKANEPTPVETILRQVRCAVQAKMPDVRSFSMNIDTGDVEIEVVQRIRMSV